MASLLRSVILNTFVTLFVSFFVYAGVFLIVSDNKPRNFKELLTTIKNITHVKENIKNMYAKSYNQVELLKIGDNDEMVDESAKKILNQSSDDEKKLMDKADQIGDDSTRDPNANPKPAVQEAQTATAQPAAVSQTKPVKPAEVIDSNHTATIELDLTKKVTKTIKK